MQRKLLMVSGKVQGVGFRFTTQMLAADLGLTGWVQNKEDGRVEIEVQGNEDELNTFTTKLYETRYPAKVKDVQTSEINYLENESKFTIKH